MALPRRSARLCSISLLLPLFCSPLLAQGPATESASSSAVVPVLDEATIERIIDEGIEHTQAMRLLDDLTSKVGHRLTGSDNFTAACDWAVAEFTKMGLSNVHKEPWGEWKLVWNRGIWRGRITSPIEMDMYVATEAWTAGTDGEVQGVIRYMPDDMAELRKMIEAGRVRGAFLYASPTFFGRRMSPGRQDMLQACEEAGVAGLLYKAEGNQQYPTRVRVFGSHRTAMGSMDDVPTVPRIAIQSDHAARLEELLEGDVEVQGDFLIENTFREGPITLNNVIAEIPGTTHPEEVVIVCGHLDSWHQAQGCTDNGTGATSTMEAARILAAVGSKPARTIRFCLWGGEEQGLLGSAEYVKRHRSEMEKVSAVFNHDTGTNWATALTVAETMYGPMLRVMAPMSRLEAPDADHDGDVFTLRSRPTISGCGGSDHASFIAAGVPGLNWDLTGRSDYFGYTWHTQWDRFDVAIPEYQRHTSTVVALAALGTANLPEMLDRSGVQRQSGRGQAGNFVGALFGAEMDGMKFTKIEAGGRADTMGIKSGDVLEQVQGQPMEQLFDLFRAARNVEEGTESLELVLDRGGEKVKVQFPVEAMRNMGRRGGRGGQGRGGPGRGGEGGGGPGRGGQGARPRTGGGQGGDGR